MKKILTFTTLVSFVLFVSCGKDTTTIVQMPGSPSSTLPSETPDLQSQYLEARDNAILSAYKLKLEITNAQSILIASDFATELAHRIQELNDVADLYSDCLDSNELPATNILNCQVTSGNLHKAAYNFYTLILKKKATNPLLSDSLVSSSLKITQDYNSCLIDYTAAINRALKI